MESEEFNMVQECTNSYRVKELENGDTQIVILIPERFKWIWIKKLSELKTHLKELDETR